ncbi:hypothetical protein T484DRAFT_1767842 [Baffinella frigidus]|nr:hypothetical protein T484DRAFT_1767842 [Cryptophyta sp. CCMP2293]
MGTHPSTAAPCAKKRSSNPPTSADASAAGTKKQRTALAALPPADYAGEYAKSMHGRVQMGDALSESVAMLIESHLDAKDIVNVRRFAQRICDGICSFAGRAHKLSLTDYRFAMPRRAASRAFSVDDVFLRDEGDAAASSSAEERSSNGDPSDVDSSTEERSSNGDPFDVDLPEFADHRMHDFEPTECMLGDPFLLEELHAQERPYTGLTEGRVCAQGLWGERAWLSAKTTADQTQCHTARSITAACAHRLNLTTFVFCENMAEFSDAVLRLQAQFGNTRVPVMEFLVGDWCDLPTPCSPASHGVWVSMDEVSLRDAMQRSLKDTMQRAGIVVVDVVRLLDEMLAMVKP